MFLYISLMRFRKLHNRLIFIAVSSCFCFFYPKSSVAQDTLLLINGSVLQGKFREEGEDWVVFEKFRTGKKHKLLAVDFGDIYSLHRKDSAVRIYYVQDTADPQSWTVEQMARYIRGEQLAQQHYRPVVSRIGAFAAGAGGAWLGFAGLLIPVAYLGGLSMLTPTANRMPAMPEDEVVIAGFRDEARRIRNRSIAKTILPGILLGWTIKVVSGGLN